jgi:PAS domain S-box-containing protein
VHDAPIEYASESFERLTGYTKHEIIGQNCRFLQSPDGKVTAGIKRKYCDDDAVLYLKNCISTQAEAQISLINYRKGGQPFMNLLTMIPILDEMGETTHFVGFQVDLVENPTAINAKNPGRQCLQTYHFVGMLMLLQMAHIRSTTRGTKVCLATSSLLLGRTT